METACKKNKDTRWMKTESVFTSSLDILVLFKNFFISLFSASHDILKTWAFRNYTISLRIYWHIRKVGPKTREFWWEPEPKTQDPKEGTRDPRPGTHLIGQDPRSSQDYIVKTRALKYSQDPRSVTRYLSHG